MYVVGVSEGWFAVMGIRDVLHADTVFACVTYRAGAMGDAYPPVYPGIVQLYGHLVPACLTRQAPIPFARGCAAFVLHLIVLLPGARSRPAQGWWRHRL